MPIRPLPWWLVELVAPLVPLLREITEMRYLWQVPVELDNRKLRATLGEEPHGRLDQAVRQGLIELGCLDIDSPASSESSIASVRFRSRGF